MAGRLEGKVCVITGAASGIGAETLRRFNEEGATTVGVGKYISKRVYIGVEQGAQAGSSEVTVNVDLTKNLSLETNVGATAESRVGVNWKWDY